MAGECIYLGAKNTVAAIDRQSGQTVWQTKLSGSWMSGGYVNMLVAGGSVFAHAGGKLYCLDRRSGAQLWVNELPGMGYDFGCMAVEGQSSVNNSGGAVIEQVRRQQESSGATTSGT